MLKSRSVDSSPLPRPPTVSTCPPGTIRTYIADGKLRGYKVGKLIKVDVKEIDALVVTIDNS